MILNMFAQIIESIFFALFIISAKNINNKKLITTILIIIEYILLANLFPYNILFQFIFTFMCYALLKLIYGKTIEIIDVFIIMSAGLVLMIINLISFIVVAIPFNNLIAAVITCGLFQMLFIKLFRNKIRSYYKKVYSNWNRKPKQVIKSLTIRNICIVVLNLMFYLINLWLVLRLL